VNEPAPDLADFGRDARDHQIGYPSAWLAPHDDYLGGDDAILAGGLHVERLDTTVASCGSPGISAAQVLAG